MNTLTNEQTEAAITATANRLIAAASAKSGIPVDQLPAFAIEDAKRTAADMVARDAARAANPMIAELEAEREKNRLLAMQLEAIKQTRVNAANDTKPAVTVDVARAKLGESTWFSLTDAGRLQSIGVDPSTVTAATKQEILEIFGPRSDSHRASDLFKANAGRYRHLKNIGKCLNWI